MARQKGVYIRKVYSRQGHYHMLIKSLIRQEDMENIHVNTPKDRL